MLKIRVAHHGFHQIHKGFHLAMVGIVDDFSEAKQFFWAGLFPRPVDFVRTVHGDGLI